ncbi:MAG: YtxH domain-containing protein [Candidatus Margulisbacteria bacterium]|nr:YtxH domain-containing protein [Candidatus Margulisiibacteriota bacterium]
MGKIMKSLTLGGIIGFIAGLFFAPGKGEETRKKVQAAVEKGKEKFKEIKEEFLKKEE